MKPLILLLRGHRLGYDHSQPRMTVIMVDLLLDVSFPDHTQLLAPLILAICSVVFNNALGHKFLYRLIQSNWDSFEGTVPEVRV